MIRMADGSCNSNFNALQRDPHRLPCTSLQQSSFLGKSTRQFAAGHRPPAARAALRLPAGPGPGSLFAQRPSCFLFCFDFGFSRAFPHFRYTCTSISCTCALRTSTSWTAARRPQTEEKTSLGQSRNCDSKRHVNGSLLLIADSNPSNKTADGSST
jgi:hypothetical protein